MARRKSRKKTYKTREPLPVARANALRSFFGLKLDNSFVESRRRLPSSTPQRNKNEIRKPKNDAKSVTYQSRVPAAVPAFSNPLSKTYAAAPVVAGKVRVCQQRATRKEVIHALNHAGKGGQKKPVRTELSNIKC